MGRAADTARFGIFDGIGTGLPAYDMVLGTVRSLHLLKYAAFSDPDEAR
ncbi:MAG: hypothetical protein WA966_08135 [Ornithinimicrobium sp.]